MEKTKGGSRFSIIAVSKIVMVVLAVTLIMGAVRMNCEDRATIRKNLARVYPPLTNVVEVISNGYNCLFGWFEGDQYVVNYSYHPVITNDAPDGHMLVTFVSTEAPWPKPIIHTGKGTRVAEGKWMRPDVHFKPIGD